MRELEMYPNLSKCLKEEPEKKVFGPPTCNSRKVRAIFCWIDFFASILTPGKCTGMLLTGKGGKELFEG